MTRLFEKIDGLLVEVPHAEADKRREGRRHRGMSFVAEVLFTPEEEAARDAEEARAAQEREQRGKDEAAARARRAIALAKLETLGISAEDLRDALG